MCRACRRSLRAVPGPAGICVSRASVSLAAAVCGILLTVLVRLLPVMSGLVSPAIVYSYSPGCWVASIRLIPCTAPVRQGL